MAKRKVSEVTKNAILEGNLANVDKETKRAKRKARIKSDIKNGVKSGIDGVSTGIIKLFLPMLLVLSIFAYANHIEGMKPFTSLFNWVEHYPTQTFESITNEWNSMAEQLDTINNSLYDEQELLDKYQCEYVGYEIVACRLPTPDNFQELLELSRTGELQKIWISIKGGFRLLILGLKYLFQNVVWVLSIPIYFFS